MKNTSARLVRSRFLKWTLLMATLSTTACFVQTEVVMLSQREFPPVPSSSVRVFLNERDVLFQYERIAELNASEIGSCSSDIAALCVQREQLIGALKNRAGELGADGVILRGARGSARLGALAIRNLGTELHPALAVLPFRDLTVNGAYQYFGDGLSEAVLNTLSKSGEIRVVGRTSTFSYDRQNRDIRMIGEQLGVQFVLDGTILVTGSRARITARLLDAADERLVWSETYDRGLGDVTATELAQAIAPAVEWGMAGGADELLVASTADAPPAVTTAESRMAHNSYLLGRFFWNKRTAADLQTAASHFEEAVGADSTYALAWSGLADSYILFPPYGVTTMSAEQALTRAEAAARRAVALDGNLAEARTSLALVLHAQWEWAGAQSEFTQATLLNPGYATARQWYAVFLAGLNRMEESLAVVRHAEELDPLSPIIGGWVALVLDAMGAQDQAAEQYRKVLALHPDVDFLRRDAWLHSLRASDYESAAFHLQRYLELTCIAASRACPAGSPMATQWPDGVRNEATRDATLRQIADATADDYKMSTDLNMMLGNEEAALQLLERLLVSPVDFGDSAGQLRVYVLDADLRGNPRFWALMENMGLTST